MHFVTFIYKNIARRRFRSTFTIVGVAVAVGAVVALVGISDGFSETFSQLYEQRGIDVVIVRAGVTERLTSSLDESIEGTLRQMPEVRDVAPELLDTVSFQEVNVIGVPVYGWQTGSLPFKDLTMLEGQTLRSDSDKAVLLGTILAKNLGKKAGDTIEIYDEPFRVDGVFQSFSMYENGSIVIPIAQLQRLIDRRGKVTLFDIVAADRSDRPAVDRLIKRIEGLGKGLSAMTTNDFVNDNTQIRVGHAMAWLTSAIALVLGTVGVLNTMVMSVVERTQEIGILRAIGWRRSRVVRMIMIESLVLSLLGAALGSVGAVLLCRFLSDLPRNNGLINGSISAGVILNGVAIALVVGLIGGFYPAMHGARLTPDKALRHE
jgi:putative ABC transport system permease protein